MTQQDVVIGVLLDDAPLTLEELAAACAVEPRWVVERVEAGFLGGKFIQARTAWEFSGADLARARRLAAIERDFDANRELAALVADLMEEVKALKCRLHAAGLR